MPLILEPLRIGKMFLNNRLVMSPMYSAKAEIDGKTGQALLDYYAEKSHGGYIGLIIIEHNYVSQEGKSNKNQMSIADDSVIEGLKKLANLIHSNGSKVILQINHAGSAALKEIIGTVPVAPSAVTHPRKKNEAPNELSREEISKVVTQFKKAAERVKNAGFDGVEIHSAHGFLLNQFLSPLTNKRNDEYGGSVYKRIRIHLEIIEAVRKTVGRKFPIFLRLAGSDYIEGGITLNNSLIAAREFEKAGVDILDISGGFCGYTVPEIIGHQGFFSPITEAIKRQVSIPIILTGGITKAKAAEQLLIDGKADLIGVGRAILENSNWAKHTIEYFKYRK